MLIEAKARFVCTHRYVVHVSQLAELAKSEPDRLLLVCERCGHRAEQLPLPRGNDFGRVIAFPIPAPAQRYVPVISEHEPPPLLSA